MVCVNDFSGDLGSDHRISGVGIFGGIGIAIKLKTLLEVHVVLLIDWSTNHEPG